MPEDICGCRLLLALSLLQKWKDACCALVLKGLVRLLRLVLFLEYLERLTLLLETLIGLALLEGLVRLLGLGLLLEGEACLLVALVEDSRRARFVVISKDTIILGKYSCIRLLLAGKDTRQFVALGALGPLVEQVSEIVGAVVAALAYRQLEDPVCLLAL